KAAGNIRVAARQQDLKPGMTTEARAQNPNARPQRFRLAGAIGNALDWYDFAVYGYFAPIFATQFFPSSNYLTSLIAAFGVFAVGFLTRPLGGILIGHIGDIYGRR